ncbi:hypothetical protein GYA37_00215 [candidate division WWE3 bacterium]|uniref:Uncharacterized protein n=1 Tax=candidate division WWE3 bacterium TaxID=2053526 RepID=A0A7X9E6J7_UNCKA|nr:hypothetical protein [candidate division WWE3 bacterium]
MKKKTLFLLITIIFLLVIFVIRFVLGGDEDTWIKNDNQWVKHGNPSKSAPSN